MKVLIISGSYPPIKCGVSEGTVKLSAYVRKCGAEVKILTSSVAMKDEWSMPIVNKWTLTAWPVIAKAVRDENPDLIHIEYPAVPYGRKPFINFLPLLLRLRFPRIPVVVRAHEYHDASWIGKIRVLLTVVFANGVVIPNQESIKAIRRALPWKKFTHIQIGSNIDFIPVTDSTKTALAKKFGLNGKRIVTYFGLVDPSKGLHNLLAAAKSWPDDTKLVIATYCNPDDMYHAELKAQVDVDPERFVWTGFLPEDEASAILQMSELAALPFDQPVSLRRGSLLAAMLHGLAVVTTGPANLPLESGVNSLLTHGNQAKALNEAISRLLDDQKLRTLIGVNAKALVKDFDWNIIGRKHFELYQQFISKN